LIEWLRMPIAASAHAADIDRTMALVHWLMLVLFVGWSTFFVFVLVRFRRTRNPQASYHGLRGNWSAWIEGAVLAAEIALLVFFSIPIWSQRVDALPAESQSTVVRVVAEQFAWNVHYPGADRTFGRTDLSLVSGTNPLGLDRSDPAAADDVTTVNQLHLPVNRPVVVYLTSKDVVHSFALPQMRIKQDATPGLVTPVWFTPVMTGEWEIACAQLCGLGHYRMKGFYSIEPQAAFDQWLAANRP
jgi:cytochrome c oxidase subunit 2